MKFCDLSLILWEQVSYGMNLYFSRGKISIEFRTKALDGVIFYAAGHRVPDFESLFMRAGKLTYGFNYGSSPQFIECDQILTDNEWHNVSIATVDVHSVYGLNI